MNLSFNLASSGHSSSSANHFRQRSELPDPYEGGGSIVRAGDGAATLKDPAEGTNTDLRKEDDDGIYTVRGQIYLEGKLHEDKMRADVGCEIHIDELDEWLTAKIVKINIVFIPNTDITFKTFDVKYFLVREEESIIKEEKDVRSDRLRLLVDKNHMTEEMRVAATDEVAAAAAAEAQVEVVMNENTGLGGWSTVSVNVYDEAEEEAKRLTEIQEEEKERKRRLKTQIMLLESEVDMGESMSGGD